MTDNSENAQLPSKENNVTIGVVQRVAEAAWRVLNHDNDPHSGLADDTANWHALTSAIRTELERKHAHETLYDGWKPMETANPSQLFASSTWVLLHTDAGMVTEATPYYFDGSGYIWMTARGENVRGSDDEKSRMLRVKPLHWRPLPKPPTLKAGEQQS